MANMSFFIADPLFDATVLTGGGTFPDAPDNEWSDGDPYYSRGFDAAALSFLMEDEPHLTRTGGGSIERPLPENRYASED
jgi:hypothetical protein